MKLKILSATLLSTLSLIANAETIKNVEIKSFKPTMTINKNGEVAKAYTIVRDASTKVGWSVTPLSQHEVYLSNPTNHYVRYTYEFKICGHIGKVCISANRDKTLAPGESFSDGGIMEMELRFAFPGNYQVFSYTILDSEFSGTIKHESNAWVYVTK